MQYLRTKLGTSFKKKSLGNKALRILLFFIPEANLGYRNKIHLVREWLVEFDEEGIPFREIGLDQFGKPLLAGPDERNYSLWSDTGMKVKDFEGEEVSEAVFETMWNSYFGLELSEPSH